MFILILVFILVVILAMIGLEHFWPSQSHLRSRLQTAGVFKHATHRESELARDASERIWKPLLDRFSGFASRLSPQSSRALLAQKIQAAGMTISVQMFLAIKGALVGLGILLAFIGLVSGLAPLFLVGMIWGALSYIGPERFLAGRARERRETMERALPDTLDLLTVSVEAGLGFDAAIAKVCEKMSGPLIDEFKLMSYEMRVGQSRPDALRHLSDRVQSQDLSSFIRAVLQAEEMGSSLSRTLRVQAQDMRTHRQLAAEEKAMKAPIKMLFPTVLFIFPAMFIVILGPAMLSLLSSLRGVS